MIRPCTLGSGRFPAQNALELGVVESAEHIKRRLRARRGASLVSIDDRGAIRIRPISYIAQKDWPTRWVLGTYRPSVNLTDVMDDVTERLSELADTDRYSRMKG